MARRASTAVISPGLGLYYDRDDISVPARALQDGNNFRIADGLLTNALMGWRRFSTNWKLQEGALAIINFLPRTFAEALVFLTATDAYHYQTGSDSVLYITPRYETGTVSRAGTTVTGVGTLFLANVKPGDKIHFGAAGFRDPSGSWDTVASVTDNTHLETVGSGAVGSGAYTIRKVFQASKINNWDFDVFVRDTVSGNDQLVITNGVDFVHSWDGNATQMTAQSAMAFKCKRVLAFKNMMLYANITNQAGVSKPMDMINSDVGAPFLAGATGVGLSEQFTCHDGQDEILAARKLGDMAMLYSERHCVAAQFVGDPLVFVFREAAIDVGPLSPYGIADFGDYHEFLGTDTSYSMDGVTLKDINNHVGREMIRRIDPVRKKSVFLHFNEERGEVYWCIPRASDVGSGDVDNQADRTWTEHYLETVPVVPGIGTPFSQRDFPFACAGYYKNITQQIWSADNLTWAQSPVQWNDQSSAAQFPLVLTGDDSGFIYILNTVQTGNGANLNSFARTGRRATQDDGRGRGLVRRIYAYLAAGMSEFQVTLYGSDTPHGTANAMVTLPYDVSQPAEGHFVSPFRVTRYFELEWGAPNGGAWEISGWDTDISPGGQR